MSIGKYVSQILKIPDIELVPDSTCSFQEIQQHGQSLLGITDFIHFLEKYGGFSSVYGSCSTLSINGPERIDGFISELKHFYDVPDNLVPFYRVGSDCLCFDIKLQYGLPECIKAWNHELDAPICPSDGITLFIQNADRHFQINTFTDFLKIVAKYREFPGIRI